VLGVELLTAQLAAAAALVDTKAQALLGQPIKVTLAATVRQTLPQVGLVVVVVVVQVRLVLTPQTLTTAATAETVLLVLSQAQVLPVQVAAGAVLETTQPEREARAVVAVVVMVETVQIKPGVTAQLIQVAAAAGRLALAAVPAQAGAATAAPA
jgi:hypothetical protein